MSMSAYRAERGLSLKDFATMIGVSPGHAHDLLHGRRKPSVDLMLRIEAKTGIHREHLRPDLYPVAQDRGTAQASAA